MLQAGFKPKVPTGERSQINDLERAATRIGLRGFIDLLKVEFADEAFRRTVVFEQYEYWLEGCGPAAGGDLLKPPFQPFMGLSFCELRVFFSSLCTLLRA